MRDLEGRIDLGLKGSVEASEGIVRVSIIGTLLFDVVFVIFLADIVEPEQNVDHAHLLWVGEREVERKIVTVLMIDR